MRTISVAVCLWSAFGCVASAGTTLPSGQPFCTNKDQLQEFLIASIKKDTQWLAQLDSCFMAKGGLKIEVIEPGESHTGMHVDKIRLFGANGSAVGYTFTIDQSAN